MEEHLPRGYFSVRLDDRGRLKLPVVVREVMTHHEDWYYSRSSDGRRLELRKTGEKDQKTWIDAQGHVVIPLEISGDLVPKRLRMFCERDHVVVMTSRIT